MINGNRLKFGYGDIAVGSDGLTQRMSFKQFKPPGKCGDKVLDDREEWINRAMDVESTVRAIEKIAKENKNKSSAIDGIVNICDSAIED